VIDSARALAFARSRSLCPDDEALFNLFTSANGPLPPGAIVELGTNKGGSAALLATPGRPLWLFDTWAGIPAARPEVDGPAAGGLTGSMSASFGECEESLRALGSRPRMIQGDWRKTLPPLVQEIGQVALLHIDGDWYDSVLTGLRLLADAVPNGGVIVLDDFGWWEGARRAFYQWCRETGAEPLLERCGRHQAWWRVGYETHRGA